MLKVVTRLRSKGLADLAGIAINKIHIFANIIVVESATQNAPIIASLHSKNLFEAKTGAPNWELIIVVVGLFS